MYWSRTVNSIDMLVWILMAAIWWFGGWLLARRTFQLRPRERLITGLATGLMLFITLSNLLSHLLPVPYPFWGASALVLTLGLLAAWRSSLRPWRFFDDVRSWPQVAALAGLILLFALINRGLAIFDDNYNLPIVSMIAAGDLPPHFHLNPALPLSYHYGLHLFAASLVRIAGFFPWSAFDLSKALSLSLTLSLAWLWVSRFIRNTPGRLIGVLTVLFGGGARWLLLFLPAWLLVRIGNAITLTGSATASGNDLFTALASTWNIDGAGPVPFPFAYANGIFRPLNIALASSGAMPQLIIFFFLLSRTRRQNWFSATIFGLILASSALTGEFAFFILWLGLSLSAIMIFNSTRSFKMLLQRVWTLTIAMGLSLTSGGVITEYARQWLAHFGDLAAAGSSGLLNLGIRWPPAQITQHFGSLSFADPKQVLLTCIEMGPVICLLPWVIWFSCKRIKRDDWFMAGIGLGVVPGFLGAWFINLQDREGAVTHLANISLHICMILGLSFLVRAFSRSTGLNKLLLTAAFFVTVFGGITLFSYELIAMTKPQLTNFVGGEDARISQTTWNQLPTNAWVLDPNPNRTATIFGRSCGYTHLGDWTPIPEWEDLIKQPNPDTASKNGYSFIYVDNRLWSTLTPQQKLNFEKPCVKRLAEYTPDSQNFRWLLDIQGCISPEE